MTRRVLAAAALAAVLAVAGCQAPIAGAADRGSTPTDRPGNTDRQPANITVVDGALAVDPGLVFARVQTVAGTDVPPPERVRAFDNESDYGNASLGGGGLSPFQEAVGLRTGPAPSGDGLQLQFAGQTSALGTVAVYTGPNTTTDDARLVVAHELVHYIQFQQGRSTQLSQQVDTSTTDGSYVVRSLVEGPAVYTTDTYLRRYTDNGTRNSPTYRAIEATLPAGHVGRYGNSQYIEGFEYVTSRVDDRAGHPQPDPRRGAARRPRRVHYTCGGVAGGRNRPARRGVRPDDARGRRSAGARRPGGRGLGERPTDRLPRTRPGKRRVRLELCVGRHRRGRGVRTGAP